MSGTDIAYAGEHQLRVGEAHRKLEVPTYAYAAIRCLVCCYAMFGMLLCDVWYAAMRCLVPACAYAAMRCLSPYVGFGTELAYVVWCSPVWWYAERGTELAYDAMACARLGNVSGRALAEEDEDEVTQVPRSAMCYAMRGTEIGYVLCDARYRDRLCAMRCADGETRDEIEVPPTAISYCYLLLSPIPTVTCYLLPLSPPAISYRSLLPLSPTAIAYARRGTDGGMRVQEKYVAHAAARYGEREKLEEVLKPDQVQLTCNEKKRGETLSCYAYARRDVRVLWYAMCGTELAYAATRYPAR
eukprot:998019-Rhodomonas_salina.2